MSNLNPAPTPDATATQRGVVNTGTQTFGGNKNFIGTVAAANLTGTNTGDQTITLTGDVTGSGTGTIATTVTGMAGAVKMTTASITLYVATTGNDANDGLTLGTPLATVGAALNKIPQVVNTNNDCIINVAAGTYAEHIAPSPRQLQANIIVQGAPMTNYTPGAGISSGTFDAAFTGQWCTLVATVAGAGWTPDTLGGIYVKVTSGALTGTILPIATNTVTTLSIPITVNSGSFDLRGLTFQLVQHATIFNTSGSLAIVETTGIIGATTNTTGNSGSTTAGQALLTFDSIKMARTTTGAIFIINDYASVAFKKCAFVNTTTNSSTSVSNYSTCRLEDCFYGNTSLTGFSGHPRLIMSRLAVNQSLTIGATVEFNLGSSVSATGLYIYGVRSSGVGFLIQSSVSAVDGVFNIVAIDGNTISAINCGIALATGAVNISTISVRNCSIGFRMGGSNTASTAAPFGYTSISGASSAIVIDSCTRGIAISGMASVGIGQWTITNCSAFGVDCAYSGIFSSHVSVYSVSTLVMSGNGADFTLDGGATSFSLATLRAGTPKRQYDATSFIRVVEL